MTRAGSVDAFTSDGIERRIRGIVGEQLDLKPDQAAMIEHEGELGKIGVSSLEIIKILIAIQSEFKIKFDFDQLTAETIKSIPKMANHVYELFSQVNHAS